MIRIPQYLDKLTGDVVRIISGPTGKDNMVSCKVVDGDPNVTYNCSMYRLVEVKPYLVSEGERFICNEYRNHLKVETFPDDEDQMKARIWKGEDGFLPAGWTTLQIVLPVLGSKRTFHIASSAEGSFVNFWDLA